VYAALPSITGKFELEYEGELKGADLVARELIRSAVANVFTEQFDRIDTRQVVEFFDLGGSLQISDTSSARELLDEARSVQGLIELARQVGIAPNAPPPVLASAVDFVLEGLYAQKKISRSDERGYIAAEQQSRRSSRAAEPSFDEGIQMPSAGKKKYYN
jgi:magnesium chelatase subunit I